MKSQAEVNSFLWEEMAECLYDPLRFVIFAFPWDEDPSLQVVDWENEDIFVDPRTGICYNSKPNSVETITYKEWMEPYRKRFDTRYGPDKWACEWLDDVGKQARANKFDGKRAVKPLRFVTASGHGIGKSTLTAWVILWIMSTRPGSRGTITANTAEQLRTKTWAELGKWHKRCITGHWFKYTSGRGNMSLVNPDRPAEWKCHAHTCREENSESFAGQHAASATSFYIFDEDSAVPDKIHEVRDGGTVTGEPMVFDFGNPTRNSGRFYENCVGRYKHRHTVRQIDSRTVAITNKDRINEWIEDFGIDSDFVKVRVLGQFPSAGTLQFIPTGWVQRAMRRELGPRDRHAALTMGVDVARFGDDNSVIYPVLGNDARSFAPTLDDGIYHGLDTVALSQKVIEKVEFFRGLGIECAAIFVDVTGIGAGVVDVLRNAGYQVTEVNFGTTPVFEPAVYRYRGDEMWGRGRDAIKNTLILPELPEMQIVDDQYLESSLRDTSSRLFADLTQREFGYTLNGEKIHLETKKDMKSRGVPSPDIADALFLNFAEAVAAASMPHGMQGQQQITNHQYNQLDHVQIA